MHGSGIKRGKATVTGGRRGIGRGIAEHLAAEGVSIATCARRADGLQAATEALKVKGVTVFSKAVDIGNGPEYKAFITEVLRRWVVSISSCTTSEFAKLAGVRGTFYTHDSLPLLSTVRYQAGWI